MITKNSVVKIQNLVMNHESGPVKSNSEVSQKFWNTVSFHLLKVAAFKTSGLKTLF